MLDTILTRSSILDPHPQVLSESPWYVVRTKANAEWKVTQSLINRGLHTFLPVRRRPSKQKNRNQIEIPLFPGYVFAQFDHRATLPVLTCPGVVHILCNGTVPEAVDPAEMHALQSVARVAQSVESVPVFTNGQKIKISGGPLADVEGIVLRDNGGQRLVVSVTLLRRSVIAEVDREWLDHPEPASEHSRLATAI